MAKGSAFSKPLKISDEMQDFLGVKKESRGGIMKGIWKYIKRKGLQDKKDKRIINPDKKLSKILGKEPIHMMKMVKRLNKRHILK